jgi:hypothetical protein
MQAWRGCGVDPEDLEPMESRSLVVLHERNLMADKETPKEPEAKHGDPVVVKHPKVDKPIVGPDGHVVLSQEDLDARS